MTYNQLNGVTEHDSATEDPLRIAPQLHEIAKRYL
jgi:hypothetical protein